MSFVSGAVGEGSFDQHGIQRHSGDDADAKPADLKKWGEVGGRSNGQFGQWSVAGSATLDGALTVTLVNNFLPASTDRFQILSCASRNGAFNGAGLPAGVSINYSNTGVFLAVTEALPVQIVSPAVSGWRVCLLLRHRKQPELHHPVQGRSGSDQLALFHQLPWHRLAHASGVAAHQHAAPLLPRAAAMSGPDKRVRSDPIEFLGSNVCCLAA